MEGNCKIKCKMMKERLELTKTEYKRVIAALPEVLLRVSVAGTTAIGFVVEGERADLNTIKFVKDKRSNND